ncbi:DUF1707 and DUF4190 domain-containing protein [Nocardia brasiliensis]|uniref:DUF1707 and DUF4190 domain-containing protein n=1 Tax=Nocardia brasiliensis TaxID=37326 RepID=UPI003D8CADCF
MHPYLNPDLLAADADRERVVAALAHNFREGRLGPPEYSTRVGQALSARTVRDLQTTLTDLPPIAWPALAPPVPTYAPAQLNRSNPVATAALWLGIFSLIGCGFPALLAIPLGLVGLAEENRNPQPRPTTAYVGIALGVAGAMLWLTIYLMNKVG